MKRSLTSRRDFLQLASGALVGTHLARGASATAPTLIHIGDEALDISLDAHMESRLAYLGAGQRTELTPPGAWESIDTSAGPIRRFTLKDHASERIRDASLGAGVVHVLTGNSPEQWQKRVEIRLFDRYPGFALYRVAYKNESTRTREIVSFTNTSLSLNGVGAAEPRFWTYSGATFDDRRDWVLPVHAGFAQTNYLGMNASDYGGGMPIVDVWRRDCGVAMGHLEKVPHLVSLPVRELGGNAQLAVHAEVKRQITPGASFESIETFLAVHRGDHFAVLDGYRRIMADRGLRAPTPPPSAYEPIWCAWGYERDCTVPLIESTLPKVKELGLKWAVIDDGWQSSVGDWRLDPKKFPRGDADMRQLVQKIRAADLRPRLWVAPLAAAPGTDLLHDHTDMLLVDKEGNPQLITWWGSLYLCPAYAKTIDYHVALVRKFLGEWGYEGLKIDGQHLNGVAPCYNPKHAHAYPEESLEKLPQFFAAIFEAARAVNPDALLELCPCGTSYSVYDFPYINQMPASDPESSWQVRLKGKSLKALYGPSAPFAGDHVELSDGGDDFASTVGVGAVVSTKFTWPVDPKPKDSFLLTPAREKDWRRWIAIYKEKMLPKGRYRGELYDIGFDEPEAHAIEHDGRMYFAFYADKWQGPLQLRGLTASNYTLRDYCHDRDLGAVTPTRNTLNAQFQHFLLIEATPA